jgi:predicted lipid-binding transport protein (Tim44 family)
MLMLSTFAATALTVSDFADAARLGAGRSIGAQRQSIAPQRPAAAPNANTASQPVMPAQPAAALPGKAAAPAAPAPSGMSRWLGPIAGIAAGLGIAALLSHFGLPEGFGSFLVIALLVIAAIFVVRMFLSRRSQSATSIQPMQPLPPMQYAGTGSVAGVPDGGYQNQSPPAWGGASKSDPLLPAAGDGVATSLAKPLPPGFDVEGFVAQAKLQFNRLQAAYDTGDRSTLSDVMTPEMYAEVGRDLSTRHEQRPTEIVTLDAEVLEVTTEDDSHWASVRYTGLLREDGEPLPKPIDEVWNLTKPVTGKSGWLLAGIQQVA